MISRVWCIIAGAGILLLSGCAFNFDRDHEVVKTEPFTALDVSGPFVIKYKKSDDFRIRVTGDAKVLGGLEISYLGHMAHVALNQGSTQTTIYVEAPTLDALYLNGVIAAQFLNMVQDVLTIRVAGTYTCAVSGVVNTLKITASGAGSLDAKNMHADTVSVEASGSSSVSVWAAKTLDIKAYGAAVVRYKGDPLVAQECAGAGSVIRV